MFLKKILDKVVPDSKLIILGDFNLNLYNPLNLSSVDSFINVMYSYSLFPVVTLPAKFNPDNPVTKFSLIDQIWTNFTIGDKHKCGIINYPISDHLPIFYIFSCHMTLVKKTVRYRLVNDVNKIDFINQINEANFEIDESQCPDNEFTEFYNKLYDIYNNSFPIKRKKIKNNTINQPWVTFKLKKCIRKKFKLYNMLRRGLIQRQSFLKYKNLLNWVMNKMRKNYYSNKFQKMNGDVKKTWNGINDVLKRKSKSDIDEVEDANGNIVKGQNMSENFNDYFCNVASDLVSDLPVQVEHRNINENLNQVNNSCYLFPSNETEVNCILLGMCNKGNPLFDITPRILIVVSNIVVPIISFLYNLCIIKGVYSPVLKVTPVSPVYKSVN